MFKAEVPSEEKISQPEYEVCDDYLIFFLEIDFLQFSKDLQYSMSYVWLLTFNKTQKIV